MTGIIDGAHIPIVVHTAKYGIRYVNAHHEEAAVHLAEGYSRIEYQPGSIRDNFDFGPVVAVSGRFLNSP